MVVMRDATMDKEPGGDRQKDKTLPKGYVIQPPCLILVGM